MVFSNKTNIRMKTNITCDEKEKIITVTKGSKKYFN